MVKVEGNRVYDIVEGKCDFEYEINQDFKYIYRLFDKEGKLIIESSDAVEISLLLDNMRK